MINPVPVNKMQGFFIYADIVLSVYNEDTRVIAQAIRYRVTRKRKIMAS